eukprot:1909971-Pleurochrysis_carterae.AAC.3
MQVGCVSDCLGEGVSGYVAVSEFPGALRVSPCGTTDTDGNVYYYRKRDRLISKSKPQLPEGVINASS